MAGCKDEKTRLPFTTPFTPVPPVITGPTPVFFSVRDQTGQLVTVNVDYSLDGGRTFKPATASAGGGVVSLLGAPTGATGSFPWDPIKDLGPGVRRGVVLRVFGLGRTLGLPGQTGPIDVDLTDRLDAPQGGGGPVVSRPIAAPLPDGSVWIAGGTTSGGAPQSSAARWEPTTGAFTTTPGLTVARGAPGAAALRGGQVLVAGGALNGVPSSAAEAFSFEQGVARVVAAAALAQAREAPAVGALGDGRALVLGGRGAGGPVGQVELFTPAPVSSSTGGAFAVAYTDARTARIGATATALLDGRVLLAGGVDAAGVPVTQLLVCTATGVTPAGTSAPRADHAAVLLPDGRVALVGGATVAGDAGAALSTAEVWDPVTSTSTTLPSMVERRLRPGLAYAGGMLVAFGGAGGGRGPTTAERLDLDATTLAWTEIAGPSGTSRPDAVAVATGAGLALVVGGQAAPEVYTPDAAPSGEAWDPLRVGVAARADHTATLLGDGGVLLAGGTARITSAIGAVERVDPLDLSVTTRASLLRPRAEHAATLIGGQVLVLGGRDGAGLVAEAELYDPALDRWTPAGALITPRARPTAVPLIDGTVLVSGGVDAAGLPLATQELWLPERRFQSTGSLAEPRADHRALGIGGFATLGPGRGSNGTPQASSVIVVSTFQGGGTQVASGSASRAAASLAAPSGSPVVLVSGGEDAAGPRADADLLDLGLVGLGGAARILTTRPLVVARAAHESVAAGRDVLLVGGRGPGGRVVDDGELFTTDSLIGSLDSGTSRRTSDRRMVKARTRHTATALLDGRVLIAGGLDERGVAIAGLELWTR